MTQDFNPGTATPSVSPMSRMGSADPRATAAERVRSRLSTIRSTKPVRVVRLVENIPARYLGRALKALTGEASSKAHIKAHCENCVGYEEVRARVGGCTSFGCMLWVVRPYQSPKQPTTSNGYNGGNETA